jgi:hypothetical protein
MGHLHILKPLGSRATGSIEEENGSGCLAIGRGVRSHTRFGCLAIGRREEEAGCGIKDIGTIAEFKFGVMSSVVTTRVLGVNNKSLK